VSETLARAAKGDQSAFAEIVRAHQSMVFSLALRFLRNRATAEELAQEVFLELFQNLSQMKSPEHMLFWLRRVATNRCIDWTRRKNTRMETALDEANEMSVGPTDSDPALSGALQRMVAALPEKPRLVVILRYQEEMEPTEIAEVLGMPVTTVKSHLRRSLASLRERLERHLGEAQR